MKLFRFMSIEEFKKYINNENLINNKNHAIEDMKKTNSIGFCFLNYANFKPETSLQFLTGIVDFDICAIFETQRKYVYKTYGRYAKTDTILNSKIESFIAEEYCTREYSQESFKLLKYTIPDWKNRKEWYWIECNKKAEKGK